MTVTHIPNPVLSTPPLDNGDKLTRAEFEQRYEAMPQVKKAELIEGTVYMASPLHAKAHGKPYAHMMGWLSPMKLPRLMSKLWIIQPFA